MPLKFRKMHAGGDDFVVIDMRGAAGAVTGDLARAACATAIAESDSTNSPSCWTVPMPPAS
jgi:diaminopimelate epimerase